MADVLRNLRYSVHKESFGRIYVSFIRPKLEYGSYIWDKGDNKNLEEF